MSDILLEVDGVRHAYGRGDDAQVAIDDLSFQVRKGEFVSIVGPSGCGKTTLLRCAAGLLHPTAGSVRVEGQLVNSVPDNLALVFQDYSRSLFPWLTVRGNVDFPLRRLGLSRAQREERIRRSLADVGLLEAADRHPWQLSGGMQQRTAIARALAYEPSVLLMDEPFASVDAQTRADLEDLMLGVAFRHEMTVLFVTHDIDESVYLADRVLVLSRSPGTVIAQIEVDLPRPRDQIETKSLDRFVALRAEVARLVRTPREASTPPAEEVPSSAREDSRS
jgi:NitT/TauT family transport system ATP-binding protein